MPVQSNGGRASVTATGTVPLLLNRRALNRATLSRQMLLDRQSMSASDALEYLVGMQAQLPNAPYVALWSRIEGFGHDALSALVADRRAVRMTLLRGTIHLVTARDGLALRPVLQPALEREVYRNSTMAANGWPGWTWSPSLTSGASSWPSGR